MSYAPATAESLLAAVARKYPSAAIVPELSIEDYELADSGEEVSSLATPMTAPPDGYKPMRRIDALMFDSLERTALEIKVSRADFMRDTYWKRRAWQRVTHRFVYVVPEGLDVVSPHGCGLWRVDESGHVRIDKRAIVNRTPEGLPQSVVQRIAYRASVTRNERDER